MFKSFIARHSVEKAVKETIGMAVRFYYGKKLPKTAKTVHRVASWFNIIKSPHEIEEKAANDFYPLVKQYVLRGLLLSVILWTAVYGIFLGVVKATIFTYALGIPVWRVLFWVFQPGIR
jgi:hypothetical protein